MTPLDTRAAPAAIDTAVLDAELEWLAQVIELRLAHYFHETAPSSPALPGALAPAPPLPAPPGPYAAALRRHALDDAERLLLILALAPQLRPQLLDVLAAPHPTTQRPYTEFGGIATAAGFQPTGETACFLLAGDQLAQRLAALQRLAPQQRLAAQDLLQLRPAGGDGPAMGRGVQHGLLLPSPAFLAEALPGPALPAMADPSPLATRVHTGLGWDDLVLPAATLAQLEDIGLWLAHGRTLLDDWGFGQRSGRGHVALFHGPPGTGKTLSACLLGRRCAREVHRVDLSLVVSKYIGETEKNLLRIFAAADDSDAMSPPSSSASRSVEKPRNARIRHHLRSLTSYLVGHDGARVANGARYRGPSVAIRVPGLSDRAAPRRARGAGRT